MSMEIMRDVGRWLKAKAVADDLADICLCRGAKRLAPRSAAADRRGACNACIKQARCLQQWIHNPGKSSIGKYRIKLVFLNLV
jgi:hypothetical protein